MNNRYLFRGKRKDGQGWIEGDLVHTRTTTQGVVTEIYTLDMSYEVDPETVGQCTGLKDKNGKMIYEGDVIEAYDEIYVNGFGEVKGKVFFNDGAFAIDVEDVGYIPLYAYGEENIEVIDNIHGGINDSKNSEKD